MAGVSHKETLKSITNPSSYATFSMETRTTKERVTAEVYGYTLRTSSMKTLLFIIATSLLPAFNGNSAEVDFARDIRPILSDKCFFCHGPDEERREADLRLDIKENAFRETDGVAAFRANDLNGSEAWHRITTDDPDDLMPPSESNKSLTPKEKELIRAWIESGAG